MKLHNGAGRIMIESPLFLVTVVFDDDTVVTRTGNHFVAIQHALSSIMNESNMGVEHVSNILISQDLVS